MLQDSILEENEAGRISSKTIFKENFFDIILMPMPVTFQGCKVRDHVVNLDSPQIAHDPVVTKVYDDLLAHRDMICIPHYTLSTSDQ